MSCLNYTAQHQSIISRLLNMQIINSHSYYSKKTSLTNNYNHLKTVYYKKYNKSCKIMKIKNKCKLIKITHKVNWIFKVLLDLN